MDKSNSKRQLIDGTFSQHHKKESFESISKRKNPERVLVRKYRQKQSIGFLNGMRSMLGPSHVVIDCGANLGEVTNSLAPTGAEIHSFEPDPFTFSRLQENCGNRPNVTLHNKAVGVGAGTIDIYRPARFDNDPDWFSLSTTAFPDQNSVDEMESVSVEQIDLEGFIKELLEQGKEIAFLKMDIEGAELAILERLIETDVLTKIRATAVEIHPWMFADGRQRFDAIRKTAEQNTNLNLNLDWF